MVFSRFLRVGLLAALTLAVALAAVGGPRAAEAQSSGPGRQRVFFPMIGSGGPDPESVAAVEKLMAGMAGMEASKGVTFKTLTQALVVSGVAKELVAAGRFTLFAPSDAAFAKLPPGTVESLLRPENRDKLKSLLRYHALDTRVPSSVALTLDGKRVKTLNGEEIAVRVDGASLFINTAKVVVADVPYLQSGVIHVLDGVLIPPSFNPPPTKDIVDTAIAAGNFTTLVAAVQAADLVDALKGAGPLTVFAPTDAAFAKLPADLLAALLKPENKGKLTEILTYHVLVGKVLSGDAIALDGEEVATLGGKKIAISVRNGALFINDSKVVAADVLATNGVIHAIDAVLIPPGFVPPAKDIVDTAIAAGNFTTLVAAVQAADLVDALKGDGPLTVFAPTDAAFAKLPADLLAALLKPENKGKLTEILTYHVLVGKVLSGDAIALDGEEVATLGGKKIAISVRNGALFINDSKVVAADVLATNGVIHAIDTVLIPPGFVPPAKDIVDTAIAAGNFTTLVAAVQAADLVDALKGDGPLTVFAPTDAAFAKLPADLLAALLRPENKGKLTEILTYHVLVGKVLSGDAIALDGQEVATLGGKKIAISVRNGALFINDSKVVAADVLATNGVIHAIDTVLIPPGFVPPAKDIVDTAIAAGNFTTLVAAVQAADLVDALKGDGPLTVFAPTDAAFAKLPAGLVSYLLKPENKALLQKVLLYHVVDGAVSSEQAKHLSSATTLQGDPVHITFNGDDLFINGARVVAADVQASNGVIHAIDTVLIPDLTLAQVLEASGNYGTFITAMKAAGLYWQLETQFGWQTVFAPTDAAFAKLPAGTVTNLLKPSNLHQLRALLNYHIGLGRATALELDYYGRIHSQGGDAIHTEIVNGVLTINGSAKAVNPDVGAVNGILHGIDTVLTPPH